MTLSVEERGVALAAIMLAIGKADFAHDLREENYVEVRDLLLYGDGEDVPGATGLTRFVFGCWSLCALEDALERHAARPDCHAATVKALERVSAAVGRAETRHARRGGQAAGRV